jgi:uridine kinase
VSLEDANRASDTEIAMTPSEGSREPGSSAPRTSEARVVRPVRISDSDDGIAGRPLFVGVAGGSGSGKTTVVDRIIAGLEPHAVTLIHHDSYYRDYSQLSAEERSQLNFDHPDSLETELLLDHLDLLRLGQTVQVPVYDFTTHTRTPRTTPADPTPVVIVDGILVLADREIRARLDIKVYLDTDPDIRFIRRLTRDMDQRGRTLESVVRQYTETVRPMHLEFVEPSKRYADVIVPVGGENVVAIDMLVTKLREVLGRPSEG